MKMKILLPTLLAFSITNCATNEKTRWALMGAAAPVGGAIGYSTAPEGEKKELHAMTWTAVFVAGAAIIGNYFYSDKKQMSKMDKEIADLKKQNDLLRNPPDFVKIDSKKGKLVFPGMNESSKNSEFYYRKTNEWINKGDKRYHADMVIKEVKKEDKKKSDVKND